MTIKLKIGPIQTTINHQKIIPPIGHRVRLDPFCVHACFDYLKDQKENNYENYLNNEFFGPSFNYREYIAAKRRIAKRRDKDLDQVLKEFFAESVEEKYKKDRENIFIHNYIIDIEWNLGHYDEDEDIDAVLTLGPKPEYNTETPITLETLKNTTIQTNQTGNSSNSSRDDDNFLDGFLVAGLVASSMMD